MNKIKSALIISALIGITACAGDDGSNGKDGKNGAIGLSGTTGSNGIDGQDASSRPIFLKQIGRYEAGSFAESAAEIVAYDKNSQRLFVVNANAGEVDVLDISDPNSPALINTINATSNWAQAGEINSVDVSNGIVAAGVQNDSKTGDGKLMLYNASTLSFLGSSDVGNLPDNVVFTPDGNKVLVANEGEPLSDYSVDPEGSVSIVDVSNPSSPITTTVSFTSLNAERANLIAKGVRIFGNAGRSAYSVTAFTDTEPATLTVDDATGISVGDLFTLSSNEGDPINYKINNVVGNVLTLHDEFNGDSEVDDAGASGLMVYLHDGASSVAQDFEPEYITVSPDGLTAAVTLQENNALAIIDITTATVTKIIPLGTKNHNLIGNELDVSDKDDMINIRNWPVQGMYMPDTIASYERAGKIYYLTANEGDAREYDAYVEEIRFKDLGEGGIIDFEGSLFFNPLYDFSDGDNLGRIITSLTGDTDGNGLLDSPVVFGGRSFTIWDENGIPVFDSGSDFEIISANMFGFNFNNTNDDNESDSRSDAKGPEPEALTIGEIDGRFYAFIGLERMGGIMIYDITNPYNPSYIQYINNRDFEFDFDDIVNGGEAGDLGPEGMKFISVEDSPNGEALLIVANEISGTTTIYQIEQ